MKCCNKELKLQKGKSDGKELFFYLCPVCKKGGKGKTEKDARAEFNNSIPQQNAQSKELQPLQGKNQLTKWAINNNYALISQSAQFIDKPATQRMIEKNIKYIASLEGTAWNKIWNSPEGQESIKDALSDSLYYAATLPDMGSIVPYGKVAEFIPAIECYEHALITGKNAPFKDINIIPVHENDEHKNHQIDGNFVFEITRGIPRGEIIAVVVSGTRTDVDKVIGEIYDIDFLIKKAEDHSPGYRSYLLDKEDFQRMKIEGKLKKDSSGREFFEKKIEYTKGGKKESFTKKLYEHEITNPYSCTDKIKMFQKSAGKSFFAKYMKVRNAAAMADEWSDDDMDNEISRDQAADGVLMKAAGQFDNGDLKNNTPRYNNIVDGEIVEDEELCKTCTKSNNGKPKGSAIMPCQACIDGCNYVEQKQNTNKSKEKNNDEKGDGIGDL